MSNIKRSEQESPRQLKQLAIYILVKLGLIVFSNIAAKETIDEIVAIHKEKELRTAGIRIKTSSFHGTSPKGNWAWSDDIANFAIRKTPFFYIFCLKKREKQKTLIDPKPWFIVISAKDLAKKTTTFRDGNYQLSISEKQLFNPNEKKRDIFWTSRLNNFKQIIDVLNEKSQASI